MKNFWLRLYWLSKFIMRRFEKQKTKKILFLKIRYYKILLDGFFRRFQFFVSFFLQNFNFDFQVFRFPKKSIKKRTPNQLCACIIFQTRFTLLYPLHPSKKFLKGLFDANFWLFFSISKTILSNTRFVKSFLQMRLRQIVFMQQVMALRKVKFLLFLIFWHFSKATLPSQKFWVQSNSRVVANCLV